MPEIGAHNPYDYLRPVSDPNLFSGRTEEVRDIEYYLDLAAGSSPLFANLALIGDRASGKTTLLHRVESLASERGFLTVWLSLNNETVQQEVLFFAELIRGIMIAGADRGLYGDEGVDVFGNFYRIMDALDTDVDHAHVRLRFPFSYVGAIRQEFRGVRVSEHVITRDLQELRRAASEVGCPGIVILLDECDLFKRNETLLQVIRNVFSRLDGYVLVFAGTEEMFPAMEDVFSPVPRMFHKIHVGRYKTFDETVDCVLRPLREEEKRLLSRSTLREVHALTEGRPYEIRLVCHFMYRKYQEADLNKIELNVDVLDRVRSELERVQQSERTNLITGMRALEPAALRGFSDLVGNEQLQISQRAYITELFRTDHFSERAAERRRSLLERRAKELEKLGLLTITEGRCRVEGDQFDKLYLKYLAESRGIRWRWTNESLAAAAFERFHRWLLNRLRPERGPFPAHISRSPGSARESSVTVAQENVTALSIALESGQITTEAQVRAVAFLAPALFDRGAEEGAFVAAVTVRAKADQDSFEHIFVFLTGDEEVDRFNCLVEEAVAPLARFGVEITEHAVAPMPRVPKEDLVNLLEAYLKTVTDPRRSQDAFIRFFLQGLVAEAEIHRDQKQEYPEEANRDEAAGRLLEECFAAYIDGDVDAAEAKASAAIGMAQSPRQKATAFNNLGYIQLHRAIVGDQSGLNQSGTNFRRALETHLASALLALHNLSVRGMLRGVYREAARFAEEAFQCDTEVGGASAGCLYWALPVVDAGTPAMKEERAASSRVSMGLLNYATWASALAASDPVAAVAIAEEAIEAYPTSHIPLWVLGRLRVGSRQIDEARTAYRAASEYASDPATRAQIEEESRPLLGGEPSARSRRRKTSDK